jgi:hypothetical protein
MIVLLLFLSLSEIEHPIPDRRGPPSDIRVGHFECFNIVRLVEHGLTVGRSIDNITDLLTSHCHKLSGTRKMICLTIVPDKIPPILTELEQKKHPEDICGALGFKRVITYSRAMTREKCVSIIDQLKVSEKKTEPVATVDQERSPRSAGGSTIGYPKGFQRKFFAVPKFCGEMEKDDRISCNIVTRVTMRKLKNDVDTGVSSGVICDKLQETNYVNFSAPAPLA